MDRTPLYIYTILLGLLCGVSTSAQKLTVESFGVAQGDLSASVNLRTDRNGVACGLLKVQLVGAGAKFEGNIMGNVSFQNNEYWVYMTEGAYLLNVSHPDCLPLSINLHDHGLKDGVQPKTTYKMVLSKPAGGYETTDNGQRYLALKVTPPNSMVTVDGILQQVNADGMVNILLGRGEHSYKVEAPGYTAEAGQVTIADQTVTKEITLMSSMAMLRVSCPTPGAQIYVNDQLKGTSPWSGTLAAGNYQIEARLANHRSCRATEQLSERANRQIELPALQPITGSLNVNFMPQAAEVWLDAKQLGTTPNIFRDVIVGRHEVEIRKSGYAPKKEMVNIAEGQTATLTGALEAMQSSNSVAASPSSAGAVETFTVNGVSFRMVSVEGGTFQMGSEDSDAYIGEKPVHRVTLGSYAIGETEVTQELWKAVMGSIPSYFKGTNLPVEQVSWEDCQEFISKLNAMTGRTFRLPTEAEWEFAARGGNKSRGYKYSGSNNIDDVAWYYDNSNSTTHPVKTKQANELGLYDMSGNVWEWCQDRYGSYGSSAQTNPTGSNSGSSRVRRGGGRRSSAGSCRSSYRSIKSPSSRSNYLGLRLALRVTTFHFRSS